MSIDRNPKSDTRQRRAFQRMSGGLQADGTSIVLDSGGLMSVQVVSPINKTASGVGLSIADGLAVSGGNLAAKVDGTTIGIDASGNIKSLVTDTNTTYTAGNGLSLTGTVFSAKLGSGLSFDGSGNIQGAYTAGDGITISTAAVSVRRRASGGLSVASGELYVNGFRSEASAPASPTNGDAWYDTTNARLQQRIDGMTAGGVVVLYVNNAQSSTIANVTAETDFDQSFTLPANVLRAGRALQIECGGVYYTTGTPTVILRLRAGSVQLAGDTFTCQNNANNRPWGIRAQVVMFGSGAAASFSAGGYLYLSNYGDFLGVRLSSTIDTTIANVIKASAQWSAASASNQIILTHFTITMLN